MKEITLTKPQSEMFQMDCYAPLFIAGYGSGKTESLIANSLRDALTYPGARVASYCPTYDLLRLNLIPRLESYLIESGIKFSLNKQAHVLKLQNGSEIIMRSMDNPARIVAYEVFRSHLDEIDTLNKTKAGEVWQKALARNRQVLKHDGKILDNRMYAYTTPDHGFASFTYDRWEKNKSDGYKYVRASTRSNPHLDPSYVKMLEDSYSDKLVEAYIEGYWCNFTSGTVYSEYDRKKNGTDAIHRKGEPIRVGMDFNVGKMALVVYVVRENNWFAVDEHTGGADTPAMADWLNVHYSDCLVTIYPDATGGATSSKSASQSDLTILTDEGFHVRAHSKNPRVRDRVNSMNRGFKQEWIYVNEEKCPVYAECLEQQSYNVKGEPDKNTGHDHSNDAGGYPIVFHHPITRGMSSGKTRGLS